MQNDQNAVRERHLKSLAAAVSNEFSNLSVSGGASYAAFTGATSITSGTGGLVPAPQAGEENYFLSGNGTWAPPTDTTYSIASTTEAGLMSAADKIKLDSIDDESNAIEEIWIDDVRQTIINKKVPLNLSDYAKKTTLDDYAKKADVASVWKRKGSVNSFSDLPTDAEEGDVYNIRTAGGVDDFGVSVQAGDNVARTFDGKWDVLAGTVDLSGYVEKVSGKQLSTEDFTTAQKRKLDNLASITSAGANITISGGTIKAANTTYTAGSNITISGTTISGTANTTYSAATTTNAGLMSASDKTKLNGIAANANNYTLPTATASTLGGVKIGSGISVSNGVISVPTVTSSANGLMSSTDKKKLDSLASITSAGNGIKISGGTISSSDNFDYQVTLSGGLYSRSVKSDLFNSTIEAGSSSIGANNASIDAWGASIKVWKASIEAGSSSITVINASISAGSSSIDARNASIDAERASINASNSTIGAGGAYIDLTGYQMNAWLGTTKQTTISAGDDDSVGLVITGKPTFTGDVTFTEPIYIYIDNTGSPVKGALCFDMDGDKPRLKMRIPGAGSSYTDFIFNCDTSITGGTG